MSNPDFVTVDVFDRPTGGRIRWRRNLRRVMGEGIEGLRGATVNYSNIYPDAGHGGIFQFHDEFVAQALEFLAR